jgi:DNA-binding response OmpR family regulator
MRRKRILVVEDDPHERLAISLQLTANRYAPVFAADAEFALAAAQRERPDLMVLDLSLPRGDGITVLECMRTIPRLADVPILVLAGRDPNAARRRFLQVGAAAFFQKPVASEDFLTAIHAALGDEP